RRHHPRQRAPCDGTAPRPRARDDTSLRITPRESSLITTFAATMLVTALALGIPIGLALERRIWQPITNRADVVVATDAPWSAIVALLFAAVIVGAIIAAFPAWRARQIRPARTLRAE